MADNFNMQPHNATWQRFTKLLTYSSVAIALLMVLMAIFLT